MMRKAPVRLGGRVAVAGLSCLLVAACLALLPAVPAGAEDIARSTLRVEHLGGGVFSVTPPAGKAMQIDLRRIEHGYDPAVDDDVVAYTDITLNDLVPRLVDDAGRDYALITLYQIDPPLADLPSREPGIDRGIDMRSPADMVKSTYSNYVSPVFTDDAERLPVASHPIGHFLVKVEIGGYPTLITGMTTIRRSDEELVDLTLGRQLGIGGVLLTPQPGRLNPSAEAIGELDLRQRRLRVVDGLYYKREGAKNVGPEYVIEDGNVVFARFRLPPENAKDALGTFIEYLWRDQHRTFGSLINRPYKGSGAGCTPFAMMWLKAAGVIPFIAEPAGALGAGDQAPGPLDRKNFWRHLYRLAWIPWAHIGCDQRVGAGRALAARYTVFDNLFYKEKPLHLMRAIPGLAEKMKEEQGVFASTLFAFGALTPLRDLVIASKRKDPMNLGTYDWAQPGQGLAAYFWDNGRFSDWIKILWRRGEVPGGITLVKEGRFLGIEVDAMDTPRQQEGFFATADRIAARRQQESGHGLAGGSCRELFRLGLQ